MTKPPRLNFKVRRTPDGARLTFTAPYDEDGKTIGATDFEIDMNSDELRKLYDETAKAMAGVHKASRRAKRVLALCVLDMEAAEPRVLMHVYSESNAKLSDETWHALETMGIAAIKQHEKGYPKK